MDEGHAILAEAVAAYQAALGPRLLAAYALGSLAHGGFSPLVSDVDLGLVLTDPPTSDDPERLRLVAESVKAGGSALHERLSEAVRLAHLSIVGTGYGRAPRGRPISSRSSNRLRRAPNVDPSRDTSPKGGQD